MSKSALAERQQPRWEVEEIERQSPSQGRQGPYDVLGPSFQQSRVAGGSLITAQPHKFRFSCELSPSPESQGSVRWGLVAPTKDLYDIGSFPFVKPTSGTTHGWLDPGEFQINWENFQHIPAQGFMDICFLLQSEGPSSFPPHPVPEADESSTALDTLQKRYKELNSKYYLGELTPEEKSELESVQEKLDELDTQDTELTAVTATIDEGYKKLHRGLAEVNQILDELLRD
jgi:hypothetical protein